MEGGNLIFLYDDEDDVNIPPPEFRYDSSKYQLFAPLQDSFGDERRFRRTLNLVVAAVAKLEIV